MELENYKIYLASASPRRRELLSQIGIKFDIIKCDVDETSDITEPVLLVKELSERKADAAAVKSGSIVIGADTVVAIGGNILGKPGDVNEAKRMLRLLSKNTHEVYTGVTIIKRDFDGRVTKRTFCECTRVTFYEMSDDEIEEYVATGDSFDKAGAYGIQGFCARYIKGIEGDYNNVVGLPVGRLYQELSMHIRNIVSGA